ARGRACTSGNRHPAIARASSHRRHRLPSPGYTHLWWYRALASSPLRLAAYPARSLLCVWKRCTPGVSRLPTLVRFAAMWSPPLVPERDDVVAGLHGAAVPAETLPHLPQIL